MSNSKQKRNPQKVDKVVEEEVVETLSEQETVDQNDDLDVAQETNGSESDDRVVELEQQLGEFKDQYLRAKAEMENLRRRSDKQVADGRKYAVESFAKELLSVRDSLQLAADVELEEGSSEAVKSMNEGVNLTLKQLDAAFEKSAIKEVLSDAGTKLDPNLHQAMTMVPAEGIDNGCIVSTLQKGYQLHERLLRPAMVIVAKNPE